MYVHKHAVNDMLSGLDNFYRKMPTARVVVDTLHYSESEKFAYTRGNPCPATAAVYRSHGHIVASVGKEAPFQLGLPAICVESVVVPGRNNPSPTLRVRNRLRLRLMQSCR